MTMMTLCSGQEHARRGAGLVSGGTCVHIRMDEGAGRGGRRHEYSISCVVCPEGA